MEEQKVNTLWNLAMKSMIVSWKSAVDKFEIDSLGYNNYDANKNLIGNSKDVEDLINYHEPHREFLHTTKKVDNFISHFEKIVNIAFIRRNSEFSTLMCWLSFFNSEVTQWIFWSTLIKDSIIYSYLKKHEIKLSKCKTVAIEVEFPFDYQSTIALSLDEITDLLTKIPNVEDLRLTFYHNSTSIVLNEKIMKKILPKFQSLKAFKTRMHGTKEIADFCQFIKKSPKIIQNLEITMDEFGIGDFKKMMKALKSLPQLVTLNIDFGFQKTFSSQEIESFKIKTKLKSVKNLTIWIKDISVLELISKCFIDIKTMKIINKDFYMYKGRKSSLNSKLENYLFGLSAFNQVQFLALNVLPTQVSAIWKMFPNLKEFTCETIELSRKDVEDFGLSTSLEKLSLHYCCPLELLLKFPNLKLLMVHRYYYDEFTTKIQPYLPANCKISKVIDLGIERTREYNVTESFHGFGKWCW